MPTIENGSKHMQAVTYTGTGATQTISGLNFQPDLIWIKSRSAATDHKLTDSVRGVTKSLESNTTDAEATDTNGVTAITSTGFTLGSDSVYNNSGATYVAWCWKAGEGTTSSNTAGSQTSTVSVNASAGFSIATFTCTGVNVNGTVGHGLGVAPKLIITKSRGSGSNWVVYHSSVSTDVNKFLRLNDTSATVTLSNVWGDALPTSTVFGIRGDVTLAASATAVAYCWSEIEGFSKFGSYTGNGSADGPFVYTGFRPKWIIVKRSDSSGTSWLIIDTSLNPSNNAANYLIADNATAQNTDNGFDILSNGFKVRNSGSTENASGGTYIYAAFAENPFKNSLAR
jgi:hypothetical protein